MDENTNATLADELAAGAETVLTQEPPEATETDADGVTDEVIISALQNPSEAVRAALQAIVNEAVKKALAKNTPRRNTTRIEAITPEQFSKMTYDERLKLFNTNRPLYEKLKGM